MASTQSPYPERVDAMKCRKCDGTGIDKEGSFTDEELNKIAKGILESKLTQEGYMVMMDLQERLEESRLSKSQQKYVLAEMGAAFPNVKREVKQVNVHLTKEAVEKILEKKDVRS